MVQVGVIVVYATAVLQLSEYLRVASRLFPTLYSPVLQSPGLLAKCALEAAFHLLLIPIILVCRALSTK